MADFDTSLPVSDESGIPEPVTSVVATSMPPVSQGIELTINPEVQQMTAPAENVDNHNVQIQEQLQIQQYQQQMSQLDPQIQTQIAAMMANGAMNQETLVNLLKVQGSQHFMNSPEGEKLTATDSALAMQLAQQHQNNIAAILHKYASDAARNQLAQQLTGRMHVEIDSAGGRKRSKDATGEHVIGEAEVGQAKRRKSQFSDGTRQRMQCWNCSPDCPNKGAGPEWHYVAGMCGRCHQRWQKHPTARWSVQRCVSKCRCDRCEFNRASEGSSGAEPENSFIPAVVPSDDQDSATRDSTAPGAVARLMQQHCGLIQPSHGSAPPQTKMLALSSLAGLGLNDETFEISAPNEGVSDMWPGLVTLLLDSSFGLGPVKACNAQASAFLSSEMTNMHIDAFLAKDQLTVLVVAYIKLLHGAKAIQRRTTMIDSRGMELVFDLKMQFSTVQEPEKKNLDIFIKQASGGEAVPVLI